jgi:hypothetical protein
MHSGGARDHSKCRKPREIRVCARPGCNNTREVVITSKLKYCSKKCANKNSGRKGKTYEEIYGDRAEEQRAKHRIPASEEKKAKQSASMKGKNTYPRTEESNRKRIEARKNNGKPWHSEEARRKYSTAMQGEKNPAWRGGIWDDPYPEEFRRVRKKVKTRDDYQCQLCGRTEIIEKKELGRGLPVHHIDYDKENCNSENLITLCCSCNSRVNFNREYWTEFFKLKLVIRKAS